MGDNLLPELCDLIFSVLIGYAGALEFLFVIRHLYHWSCGHMATENDAESLKRLQERMRSELAEAEAKELKTGMQAMKDGVLYKDGFRIDAEQLENDRLKAEQNTPEAREKRKKDIEAELERQREIEEQTRKQLAEAEAQLAKQRKQAEEEEVKNAQKLLEAERAREEQQRRYEQEREAAEEARKLLEIERQREEEERRREVEEEARRKREAEEEAVKAEEAEVERKRAEVEKLKCQEEEANRKRAAEEEEKRQQEELARKDAEEEKSRKRAEEDEAQRQREAAIVREAEAIAAREVEEQSLKLIDAEREREQEQRQLEEEEEAAENERKLLEAERLRAAEQQKLETEAVQNNIELEDAFEEQEEALKRAHTNDTHASNKQNTKEEAETLNSIMQLLDAESDRQLRERQYEDTAARERAERQRLIEENARKFLEADQEMEDLLESVQKQRRLSATESAPQSPVLEEPCIRKTMSPLSDNSDSGGERLKQTVKTQFGQTSNEPYSLTTKPLLFKSISDDTPSLEPQSSLSAQLSEEFGIDAGGTLHNTVDVQFTQMERQAPDGEDHDTSASTQYTEDYLRSLDGIKQRPLVREDGSGRRRAFKKRRSSGSSNSSFESRTSREEELKMFTSLEEEELQPKKEGESDFTPIKYASEPLLKVKLPRRRHKRSPAKDAKPSDSSIRSSLEMLDEEANTNPWGEVTPEHYKDMPFWKREKSMSIDEETIEFESPAMQKEEDRDVNARNESKASAFEEANHTQNEEAIATLKRQQPKEEHEIVDQEQKKQEQQQTDDPARSDVQQNLHTAQNAAPNSPTGRRSPRLRRSPRIDEIDQYEELWNETVVPRTPVTRTTPSAPSITINRSPDTAPWRDQYGLLMEGISDFYDFTASVNSSRSPISSRQASPASSQPSTPVPKNVEFVPFLAGSDNCVDIYDDTGNFMEAELTKENVVNLIESLQNDCAKLSQTFGDQLQNVADTPNANVEGTAENSRLEMSLLVQTMRVERQSRSRSHSPLPTGDQLERSVENRRNKLIKQNDKLFETLNLHPLEEINENKPTSNTTESPTSSNEEASSGESVTQLVEEQRTMHRSRSHSPLPTPDNLERSLETRRSRRIKQNDELMEKLGLDINTSRTPSPTEFCGEKLAKNCTGAEVDYSKENESTLHYERAVERPTSPDTECSNESMQLLVESLRVERNQSHSHSRSCSPLPTAENLRTGLLQRRKKKIQQNDALFEQLHIDVSSNISDARSMIAPIISVQCCDDEEPRAQRTITGHEESEYSQESMTSLVESLRLRRSRSKSPMRRLERERTPEPGNTRVGIIEADQLSEAEDEHDRRSRTPSRSVSTSPTRTGMHSPQYDVETDFHVLLNLEASQNRTLSKCSEEMESILAEKQRQVDAESLHKLSNASEEIELRTVTSVSPIESADSNKLNSLSLEEQLRQLRCSPTTPDYDRTISQEWNDVQRMKNEMLTSGFKRSTYVGESLDLGSEFVPLREETARFCRSRSPSPSLIATETRGEASARREVQDKILAELVSASEQVADAERLGAKPKDIRSMSKDFQDTQYEELRRTNAEFQRSRSQSRSPVGEIEAKEVALIEEEVAKRALQDKLNTAGKPNLNFEEFSRYLNAGFLDNERRASDSALIQKPEVVIQLQKLEEDFEVEPENYHHLRRFSLNQEQSVEEYPNDDYVFVSQIEVQTPSGTRTWIREDYYSEDFEQLSMLTEERASNVALTTDSVHEAAEEQLRAGEEEETDGSEDERQTVVEVDDEIDEDICDFNERGPADESHHEQSECEEAEREMDRYADREANDWLHVENVDELLAEEMLWQDEEGAVGGGVSVVDYDSDSAAIDEIYDEAIKNRKQSGILRDYDSILKEMQKNYSNNAGTTDGSEADMSAASDSDRKTSAKADERKRESESALKLVKNERLDHELRYLGDANVSERQSTRLRTRYGYMPQLHGSGVDNGDVEVDLSYKPKREYNWRKNFKVDDDDVNGIKEQTRIEVSVESSAGGDKQYLDLRKFSLGGESITLFSQGAGGVCYVADEAQQTAETIQEEKECANEVAGSQVEKSAAEKPKKKKSKKKLRKDSRNNSTEYYAKDEDDSENQIYSRRSSSIQMETDSPKRTKSRSRRSSRNSLTNDESPFSPRSSVVAEDSHTQDGSVSAVASNKKKLKKRVKTKESYGATESDIKEELASELNERSAYLDLTVNVPTASAAISPGTASTNPLATLSPQNSICTPRSSTHSETPELKELLSASSSTEGSPLQRESENNAVDARITAAADALVSTSATMSDPAAVTVATRTSTTPTTTTRTTVETFDILKDANFYPLF